MSGSGASAEWNRRDDLIRAATERQVQRAAPGPDLALNSIDAWESWAGEIINLHRLQSRDDACEIAALAGRVLDRKADERALVSAGFTEWHRFIARALQAMKDDGALRGDADPSALASLLSLIRADVARIVLITSRSSGFIFGP